MDLALAGLFYGLDAIPGVWFEGLAGYGDIRRLSGVMAEALAACNRQSLVDLPGYP
jgi:hypothetical protein